MPKYNWQPASGIQAQEFTCGYCGMGVASGLGISATWQMGNPPGKPRAVYICPNCERPSFWEEGSGFAPGSRYGRHVDHLPTEIGAIYDEARECMKVSAYTAAVMVCRKILMHVAVVKGAKENQSFGQYVDFLDASHYIPVDAKHWVKHLKDKGNDASHEIMTFDITGAKEVIDFTQMLLVLVFEFPARLATP